VFEDVTVIHKGVLPSRRSIESHQKFGLIFDENHVFPTSVSDAQGISAGRIV
jgi:hypothetical protein